MTKVLITGGCGYLGSALAKHLRSRGGHEISTIDVEWRGNAGDCDNMGWDYRGLGRDFFEDYDTIVHLAAHSTVAACEEDPWGAIDNNLTGPIELIKSLNRQRFIYASSGSVLSNNGFGSIYDMAKESFDLIAHKLFPDAIGLRLATVCGPSPNIRRTMINAMVEDGIKSSQVNMINPSARRPILGIKDFCRSVEVAINGGAPPGLHNLMSFNATVGKVAREVSYILDVPIVEGESVPTYDFTMETADWAVNKQGLVGIISSLIPVFRHG